MSAQGGDNATGRDEQHCKARPHRHKRDGEIADGAVTVERNKHHADEQHGVDGARAKDPRVGAAERSPLAKRKQQRHKRGPDKRQKEQRRAHAVADDAEQPQQHKQCEEHQPSLCVRGGDGEKAPAVVQRFCAAAQARKVGAVDEQRHAERSPQRRKGPRPPDGAGALQLQRHKRRKRRQRRRAETREERAHAGGVVRPAVAARVEVCEGEEGEGRHGEERRKDRGPRKRRRRPVEAHAEKHQKRKHERRREEEHACQRTALSAGHPI